MATDHHDPPVESKPDWSTALIVGLGVAAAAALSAGLATALVEMFTSPRPRPRPKYVCGVCGGDIVFGQPICEHCGAHLTWPPDEAV